MKRILISAGHSLTDPGACANGYREAALALHLRDQVAKKIRATIADADQVLVLTDGVEDDNQPLTSAILLAKRVLGPKVEFHYNAAQNAAVSGVEALSRGQEKLFAQNLAQAVSNATGLPLRGDKGWKDQGSGQHHRLGFCAVGGVVLELGFITNFDDVRAVLRNEDKLIIQLADCIIAEAKRYK